MPRNVQIRIATALLLMELAGCAGAGPAYVASANGMVLPRRAPSAHRGWLSPAAKKSRLIYVSDNAASAIVIYAQGQSNPSPIGEITDGIDAPLGNFVDSHGTLYVANIGNNTVTEYPKGSTSPAVTLSDEISGPISVAVDDKGNVAVSEFAQSEILQFPPNASSPTITITDLGRPEALAFDRSRHLYAAWNQNPGSSLVGQVSKCERLKSVCVSLGISEGESGGLAIDKKGNVILGDQTNHVINIYAPGMTSPTRTIATTGRAPYKFELDKSEATLYVADIANGLVATYDYASGAQTGTISNGIESAWGVSLYPAAKDGP